MSEHTKEPWIIETEPFNVWNRTGRLIARCGFSQWEEHVKWDADCANTARIVACVNACADLPDPSVVPELVAEVTREQEFLGNLAYANDQRDRHLANALRSRRTKLLALLAKLEPKP